ncbi:unnamed protein product [Linum tenue]|uniref:Uncharacterized protein n=1 Tax=Linum tenue TaxID=586396 RepID=A0AAV0KAA0_9ROSI|nr:unnamed protein product [Linum tenue]
MSTFAGDGNDGDKEWAHAETVDLPEAEEEVRLTDPLPPSLPPPSLPKPNLVVEGKCHSRLVLAPGLRDLTKLLPGAQIKPDVSKLVS